MNQAEFESLRFVDVADRAAAEPTPPEDADKYYRRPWFQLRDEMIASNAQTVGALRADRIVAFYYSTNGDDRSLLNALRSRFSGSTSG